MLGGMMIAAAFGVDTTQTFAYQLFSLCLAFLLLAFINLWFCRLNFSIKRALPRFGSMGETLYYHVTIHNHSNKLQQDLCLHEQLRQPDLGFDEFVTRYRPMWQTGNRVDNYIGYPSWVWSMRQRRGADTKEQPIPALPPHTDTGFRVKLEPLRRGYIHFSDSVLCCPEPLGLLKSQHRKTNPDSLLILPKRYPVPPMNLPGVRRYQRGGINLAMSTGDAVEFVSLRDYRPGDPLRHIHWRSWAHHNKPIVKEFQDEYFVRYALILDTFLEQRNERFFEEAVSVAASFAHNMLSEESLLDFMFVGAQTYHFTGGRGLDQLGNMLEILACVEACRDKSFRQLEPLITKYLAAMSACVCVFLDWDESRRALVEQIRRAGVPALVFFIHAGETQVPAEKSVYPLHLERIGQDLKALDIRAIA